MWRIFQRWGKVQEVFISKRLNQKGQRFGFVRFFGISNPEALEKQLDNIWIGNMKIHVNMQKYRRNTNLSKPVGNTTREADQPKRREQLRYKKM